VPVDRESLLTENLVRNLSMTSLILMRIYLKICYKPKIIKKHGFFKFYSKTNYFVYKAFNLRKRKKAISSKYGHFILVDR
jgi:hypothetical protein